MLDAMENDNSLDKTIEEMKHEHHHHHHHHHHDDEECDCHEHHHHHHDEECDCHEHHHHHHDEECDCHEHHHHYHDEECDCHEHHYHADDVFDSFGIESTKKFTEQRIREILSALSDEEKYGTVLRAKGIVDSSDGEWIYFDYIPEVIDIRRGGTDVIGKFCVIGSNINKENIKELFEA